MDFQLKPSLAPASFLVMNDLTNLYVAFRLSGPPSPGWAGVAANFDNDGDGVNSEGDEAIVVNAWQGSFRELYDEYYTTKPPCTASACLGIEDVKTGGTTDTRAASSYNGSATFFEIAQPLNSADDAHDFNLTAGDLIAVMPTTEVSWCDGTTCTRTSVSETPLRIVISPFAVPVITAVTPTRAARGTSVTISGDHLAGATAVRFRGVAVTFELKTNRELVAIVPAGVGRGPVTVTTPGGTGTSPSPFTAVVRAAVIGPPITPPKTVAAGRTATISYRVTRSDEGGWVSRARITCDPTVDGKLLPHSEQLIDGTASVRVAIPASAKGRRLMVRLTVLYSGRSATRVATFRIM